MSKTIECQLHKSIFRICLTNISKCSVICVVICKTECRRCCCCCCRTFKNSKFAGESVGNLSVCRVFCNDVFIIYNAAVLWFLVFVFASPHRFDFLLFCFSSTFFSIVLTLIVIATAAAAAVLLFSLVRPFHFNY